ncbi:MAG: hypothetical protein J5526_00020 [Bacteroidales bacterium]|nr:hypothetical protein [Bacteroidales bacterium]
MKKNGYNYRKLTNMTVGMKVQDNYDMMTLRGRVIINETESSVLFVQNPPRGPQSVEVLRTPHSRLVRRPDGKYTLTFRYSADEPRVLAKLVMEMRNIERLGL